MKKQNYSSEQFVIEQEKYWIKELNQFSPITNITTDFFESREKKVEILNTSVLLNEKLMGDLKNLNFEFSLQTFMVASYFVWIARLSNEKDIVVGVNINNNICPIRILIENIRGFEELLLLVSEKIENAKKYDFVPGNIMTNADHEVLYDTVFSINADKTLENKAKLNWEIKEHKDEIIINVEYDTSLFKEKTIKRFVKYYENILTAFVKKQKSSIYSINILTEEEIGIYKNLNNTYVDFPRNKTIVDMFEEAACNFPGNIAISSDKDQFTYKELNERSNQLANRLIVKGVEKGDFVTIFMERSLETIISILGILKAGGVYIPVEPKHPKERNSYIISDTRSKYIVTDSLHINKTEELLAEGTLLKDIILIDKDISNDSINNPSINIKPEDLAYVIYTSGSTGRPKGALIAHQGVVNLGCLIRDNYNINQKEILTQFATYSFDASVWDTFGALFWGARLHLLSEEARISADEFANVIGRIKATAITSLPTVFFNQLATHLSKENCAKLSTVKRVSVAGEALIGQIVREFQRKAPDIEVVNLYGPTESTVVATGYKVKHKVDEQQTNIPIGKPLNNYEVYIVNEENQLCPINVPGEIYIGSVGLSKGYLNQKEKTAQVFINNPFKSEGLIYKSGDIARILESGVLEYVSRKDSQVKVRGYRIEIGEIEDKLGKYHQIQDAAIIPRKDNGENILVAYCTSNNGEKIRISDVKNFLLKSLPGYMIPEYINYLEEMPIAPTGKIDRKKLETYEMLILEENDNYVAPQNEMQKILIDVWQQVLGLEGIGIYDDFFDIGGHSLKIMSALVLLKPHLPSLKIADFFVHKNVYNISKHIEESQCENKVSIEEEEYDETKIKELHEFPVNISNSVKLDLDTKPKHILLTGATGYLGSHILHELFETTDASIYCLIRKSNDKSLLEKLVDTMKSYFGEEIEDCINKRVIIIEGDLKEDKLGLSLENQNLINEKIDTIIHTAADVRHFGDVTHFEKVNVEATKNLLDIAKGKKGVRFNYVSTLGIPEDLALTNQWEDIINKEKFEDNLELENVYTNSKLQAEKMVYQAAEEMAVTVYRAGNLTCDSENGKFQKNIDNNAFYRMIKSILLLKNAPKANCFIDFTPINYASKAIVDIALKNETVGQTFHICNPEQIEYSSIIDMINEFGYKVELIEQKKYEEFLFNTDIDKNQEGVELAIAQLEGDGVKDSYYRFGCSNTIKHLEHKYFDYTKIDQEFINKMLDYGIKVGYFIKPEDID